MKIGIIGPGAMGYLFAYYFKKADINTVLLGRKNESSADTMQKSFKVVSENNTEKIGMEISNSPDIISGCSILFIFVKTYDTKQALANVKDFINKDSIIVTLQNGIGNKDKIAEFVSEDRIVYGSTSFGATRLSSDTIRLGGMGTNVIGGKNAVAVKAVEELLKKAHLEVTIAGNPDFAVWKKAIINAGINPLGALLEIPNGEIVKNDYAARLQEHIVREAVEVASSTGINFDLNEMTETTRSVCEKTSGNLCSMLQDRQAKRKTEIDSINGIIIEYGRKASIKTPYSDAVYCLIKALESVY
ncbi:MAG: 2-dehydropantoate 2-reductase [Spirochaetes bacterium]|nr:2-dehydropantoate 2-reductase [Spirochaetota bacterium]